MSQKAIALGSVGGAAIFGAGYAYHRMNTAMDRYPFIADGLKKASLPVDRVGFWKVAQIDTMNNVSHATLHVDGKTVRITAKRILSPAAINKAHQTTETDVYSDLEGEGSGLAFYWENPWEIKASIIRGISSVIEISKSYFSPIESPEEKEEENWVITSVSVGSEPIIGELTSHPFFASQEMKNDSKSPESIRRAKYCLAILAGSALFVVSKRLYTNYLLRPAYTFARDYIQKHPVVAEFYNGETAEIVARTGEFSRTKIDGEITVTGKTMSTESLIKFKASRKDVSSPWLVSQAFLSPQGSKPIDLLTSRSLL